MFSESKTASHIKCTLFFFFLFFFVFCFLFVFFFDKMQFVSHCYTVVSYSDILYTHKKKKISCISFQWKGYILFQDTWIRFPDYTHNYCSFGYHKGRSFNIGAATHYIKKLDRWNSNAIIRYIRIGALLIWLLLTYFSYEVRGHIRILTLNKACSE